MTYRILAKKNLEWQFSVPYFSCLFHVRSVQEVEVLCLTPFVTIVLFVVVVIEEMFVFVMRVVFGKKKGRW